MFINNNNKQTKKNNSAPIYGNKGDQTASLLPMHMHAHGFYGHDLNPISVTIVHSQVSC